jgi:hypothetical protein
VQFEWYLPERTKDQANAVHAVEMVSRTHRLSTQLVFPPKIDSTQSEQAAMWCQLNLIDVARIPSGVQQRF